MPNLVPCPFCGSGNVAVLGAVSCYGQCRDCGASSGLANSPEEAAELWNRRATPTDAITNALMEQFNKSIQPKQEEQV